MSAGKINAHIAVVCHAWYRDVTGGSFRLASEFAEHLAAEGYSVSYVCCAPVAPGQLRTFEAGVEVYRYQAPPVTKGRFGKLLHHISETQKLIRQIHREKPICAISSHSPLQGLGAARAIRHDSPMINYTVHSPFDQEVQSHHDASSSSLSTLIATRIARWVDSQNVRLSRVVQTDSEYTQQTFRQKFGSAMASRGITVPGWVDTKTFLPTDNRATVKAGLGAHWAPEAPIFFTLRRLENRMGLDTLVEASRILKFRGLSFRTLIGGSGSKRESLEAQIASARLQEQVVLLGRLPEDQLPLVYAAADCFVLPTRALECFGLIVLEAFSCNTPVIASNVAAIPELAEQQGNGWMFEPGNAEQLADRMQAFLETRLQPTVNLREIALQYDKAKVLNEWERVLLGQRGKGTAPRAEGEE